MRTSLAGIAALVVAGVLTGCGGGGSGWSQAACRREANWLAERADAMVSHYAGATVYPADMSYLTFRDGLARFDAGGCDPGALGRALRQELRPNDRARFVSLLPAEMARAVRHALAASA